MARDPGVRTRARPAPPTPGGRCARRPLGGVILEIVVSMAIFVGAASFTLAATRGVLTALERVQREQVAIDLARSRLAELEAGLINLSDLRDDDGSAVGSIEMDDSGPPVGLAWSVDVRTERTAHGGLTLVELTVSETPAAAARPDEPEGVSVTLRQLVRLRDEQIDEYEQDELLEGLPETEP